VNELLIFFGSFSFSFTKIALLATISVQSQFAETRFAETLTLTLKPNFGDSGFGESGRHHHIQLVKLGG